jgi:hypothetical protein
MGPSGSPSRTGLNDGVQRAAAGALARVEDEKPTLPDCPSRTGHRERVWRSTTALPRLGGLRITSEARKQRFLALTRGFARRFASPLATHMAALWAFKQDSLREEERRSKPDWPTSLPAVVTSGTWWRWFMEKTDLQLSNVGWDHELDGGKDGTMWKSSLPSFATSDGFWRWFMGSGWWDGSGSRGWLPRLVVYNRMFSVSHGG